MQIVRTIVWVLILFGILTFSFFNWEPVEVDLWENLVLETKIPVLVITAFEQFRLSARGGDDRPSRIQKGIGSGGAHQPACADDENRIFHL